ncbi:MAG: FCD domain-containing protein [Pseudomonadota bacterium]
MDQLDDQYKTNLKIGRTGDDTDLVDRVRRFIDAAEFVPGDRLPSERRLIEELGIPRAALRKAFDSLEREGLIWRHVGKGTFMSREASSEALPAGDWVVDVARQLTPLRMVRARLCIEPAIASEAAVNASAESVTRMRLALERACSASSWEDYERQDDLFHRAIAEASDNLLLLGLFDQLNKARRAITFGAVKRHTARPSADHSSFGEHEAIAAAIEARDRQAAQDTMRAHLHSVSRRLFEEN